MYYASFGNSATFKENNKNKTKFAAGVDVIHKEQYVKDEEATPNSSHLNEVSDSYSGSSGPPHLLKSAFTSVADPGFSPGGCANSQDCYYFSNFCQKLHENERIWSPRGGGAHPLRPPLDPPMHLHDHHIVSKRKINDPLGGPWNTTWPAVTEQAKTCCMLTSLANANQEVQMCIYVHNEHKV